MFLWDSKTSSKKKKNDLENDLSYVQELQNNDPDPLGLLDNDPLAEHENMVVVSEAEDGEYSPGEDIISEAMRRIFEPENLNITDQGPDSLREDTLGEQKGEKEKEQLDSGTRTTICQVTLTNRKDKITRQ